MSSAWLASAWSAPDWPVAPRVRAMITTRRGGCSDAPFDSFNLGTHVGDAPAAVAANRAALRAALPAEPRWLEQVHGIDVVDPAISVERRADAAVTRAPGEVLVVMTADCLPVFLAADSGAVVGIAHAGWRGLAAGVIEAAVARMQVEPARIRAFLGPGISARHYEVGGEVRATFVGTDARHAEAFHPVADGKYLCDLYAIARMRLGALGVVSIHGGDACSYRDRDRFFSHRRDGRTGRMASLIWIG